MYHQVLKSRWNDFIIFGEKKNGGRANLFRICDAIEARWNLQSHRASEKPNIPPAIIPQNHLAQWRWIVENETAPVAVDGNVHGYSAANARTKNKDGLVVSCRFQRIECCESGVCHS